MPKKGRGNRGGGGGQGDDYNREWYIHSCFIQASKITLYSINVDFYMHLSVFSGLRIQQGGSVMCVRTLSSDPADPIRTLT